MKVSKSGILAVVFGGLMVCSQFANAQDATNTPPKLHPPGQGPGARPGGPYMNILQQLDLSQDQKDQVGPIMRESGKKLRDLNQEGALTPEEKLGQMKEIMEGTSAKLKKILTPDQFAKFQKLSEELREKRAKAAGKMKMPGSQQTSDLPTNSAPVPGLGQNTN